MADFKIPGGDLTVDEMEATMQWVGEIDITKLPMLDQLLFYEAVTEFVGKIHPIMIRNNTRAFQRIIEDMLDK